MSSKVNWLLKGTYVWEMFFHLEKLGNDLTLCPKVRGNPEMIRKRVMELAG